MKQACTNIMEIIMGRLRVGSLTRNIKSMCPLFALRRAAHLWRTKLMSLLMVICGMLSHILRDRITLLDMSIHRCLKLFLWQQIEQLWTFKCLFTVLADMPASSSIFILSSVTLCYFKKQHFKVAVIGMSVYWSYRVIIVLCSYLKALYIHHICTYVSQCHHRISHCAQYQQNLSTQTQSRINFNHTPQFTHSCTFPYSNISTAILLKL